MWVRVWVRWTVVMVVLGLLVRAVNSCDMAGLDVMILNSADRVWIVVTLVR